MRLRVECTIFGNLQRRARTHAVLLIGLYELLGEHNCLTHWATQGPELKWSLKRKALFTIICFKSAYKGQFKITWTTVKTCSFLNFFYVHIFRLLLEGELPHIWKYKGTSMFNWHNIFQIRFSTIIMFKEFVSPQFTFLRTRGNSSTPIWFKFIKIYLQNALEFVTEHKTNRSESVELRIVYSKIDNSNIVKTNIIWSDIYK